MAAVGRPNYARNLLNCSRGNSALPSSDSELRQRLKVMHVVYSLHTGGLENGVVNLCNCLDPGDFEPSICVFNTEGALEQRVDTERVALHALETRGGIDVALPVRLACLLRRRRIDILHTHSWGTLVEGSVAAKLARTPIVIHGEHGIMEERPRNVWAQRWLWPLADQVTSVAAPLADRMAGLVGFPRDRIKVIANGVDTQRFRPLHATRDECRRQFRLPQEAFLIGMVARLDPVKNHIGMFRALLKLRASGIEAKLVLAGDGPLRDSLHQTARDLCMESHVYFLGNVSCIERLLNSLDVFVLNSHSEGMSNTLLEAMACGLPVVATAVGSNPMLVDDGDSGYLVPTDDVASLLHVLKSLALEPSLRDTMGRAGRERVRAEFSIERMVENYERVYRRTWRGRLSSQATAAK